MKLNKTNWTKEDYDKFIEYLYSLKDEKYLEFQSKLICEEINIIGVRIPKLKEIAKDSKTNIDIEKCEKQFNYVLNKFINLCKEDMFFDLINKSEQIPEHLKRSANQLNKLIEDNTNDSIKTKMEIKNTVRNMLMNYKNFRTILMYIDSYTNNKEIFKTTLLPNAKKRQKQLEIKEEIVDYDREEKEEFLTEEEIEYGYHGNKPTR